MKFAMIVNPNAGKKTGMKTAEYAASRLEAAGIEIVSHISREAGETYEIARALDTADYTAVIALGGDGTLFEVINGLLSIRDEIPIPLGQIPVGTGNSFIKDLGIEDIDTAIERLIEGNTVPVDLGHFTSGDGSWYFINLLGAGFVSNVAYRAKRYKAMGPLSYVLGVLDALTRLKAVRTTLEIDGKTVHRNAIFTEICNSRYTGGSMMMAPSAVIDDGKLDIVLCNKITRRKVLSIFPSIFQGAHIDGTLIESFRGSRITLTTEKPLLLTPDGETFGATPIEVRIFPKKIKVFG